MPLIHDSEMKDFEATIINAGFEVADFNPEQDEDPPTAKEQYAITGTVTVLRMSTGDSKTYRGGYRSTWVAEFEIDLHGGIFSQPQT